MTYKEQLELIDDEFLPVRRIRSYRSMIRRGYPEPHTIDYRLWVLRYYYVLHFGVQNKRAKVEHKPKSYQLGYELNLDSENPYPSIEEMFMALNNDNKNAVVVNIIYKLGLISKDKFIEYMDNKYKTDFGEQQGLVDIGDGIYLNANPLFANINIDLSDKTKDINYELNNHRLLEMFIEKDLEVFYYLQYSDVPINGLGIHDLEDFVENLFEFFINKSIEDFKKSRK